ncbi:MAG TPA: hypothetical protein VKC64_13425 [Burkholderiales bacterium]|nr:hypothetical protein [Burkholderiales bacterium]
MGLLVTLRGTAGNYRVKAAIWELGGFCYRAYVYLAPAGMRRELARRSFVSVGGATLQEVLGATEARVRATAGIPMRNLEVRAALRNRELEALARDVIAPASDRPNPRRKRDAGITPSPFVVSSADQAVAETPL